ncbi:MAG: hypothetical protein FWF24_06830 [Alphaproteobacteria bacterium]|nr:hypothetical protein [Alphaproteobacteria bacterium]
MRCSDIKTDFKSVGVSAFGGASAGVFMAVGSAIFMSLHAPEFYFPVGGFKAGVAALACCVGGGYLTYKAPRKDISIVALVGSAAVISFISITPVGGWKRILEINKNVEKSALDGKQCVISNDRCVINGQRYKLTLETPSP